MRTPGANPLQVKKCLVTGRPACTPALISIHHPLLANTAVCLIALDGRFIDCNSEFERSIRTPRFELQRTTIFERTHPDDVMRLTRMFRLMLDGRVSVWESYRRGISGTGQILISHFTLTSVKVGGHPLFFVGFCLPKAISRVTGELVDDTKLEGCGAVARAADEDDDAAAATASASTGVAGGEPSAASRGPSSASWWAPEPVAVDPSQCPGLTAPLSVPGVSLTSGAAPSAHASFDHRPDPVTNPAAAAAAAAAAVAAANAAPQAAAAAAAAAAATAHAASASVAAIAAAAAGPREHCAYYPTGADAGAGAGQQQQQQPSAHAPATSGGGAGGYSYPPYSQYQQPQFPQQVQQQAQLAYQQEQQRQQQLLLQQQQQQQLQQQQGQGQGQSQGVSSPPGSHQQHHFAPGSAALGPLDGPAIADLMPFGGFDA
jgi:hypothetical protein